MYFAPEKYIGLIVDLFSENATPFNPPRRSDWRVTGVGNATFAVETPIANIGVAGGTTEIALRHQTANLALTLEGAGGGGSVGASIALPVTFNYGGGQLGIEGISLGRGMDLPSSGLGSVIAGPKANSVVIAPNDLVAPTAESGGAPCMTVISGSAGTAGQYSIGVVLFADRPVLHPVDLAYTKAVSFVAGMALEAGTAIGAGVSAMVYAMRIRESTLPFPGARYGASVMDA